MTKEEVDKMVERYGSLFTGFLSLGHQHKRVVKSYRRGIEAVLRKQQEERVAFAKRLMDENTGNSVQDRIALVLRSADTMTEHEIIEFLLKTVKEQQAHLEKLLQSVPPVGIAKMGKEETDTSKQ